MGRLSYAAPRISTLDTRRAKPIEKEADAHYLTPEHKEWRKQVLNRAGWRCEFIDTKGKRCDRSQQRGDRMIADHIVEIKDGGALLDVRNGRCLCTAHNTKKGIEARNKRTAASA